LTQTKPKWFHLYFYFIFLVYTTIRDPSDYCKGIESPALQIPVNRNVNDKYDSNIYQNTHKSDINYPSASSSGADKGKTLYFDLNQPPLDGDE